MTRNETTQITIVSGKFPSQKERKNDIISHMKKVVFVLIAGIGIFLICAITLVSKEKYGFKLLQLSKKTAEDITQQGLIQTVFNNPDFGNIPTRIQIDRHPGFYHKSKKPFSCIWYGYLSVDKPGEYRIGTLSDDGSFVYIDNELVIDNGGMHGPRFIESTINLTEGLHPLEIRYFDNGGISAFKLYWGNKEIWPFHTYIPKKNLLHLNSNWTTVSLENLRNGIAVTEKVYLTTYLKVPMEGEYKFQLNSNCPIGMNLRRNQINSKTGKIDATIPLRKKKYRLIITMSPINSHPTLTLSWQPPNSKMKPIPKNFLIVR